MPLISFRASLSLRGSSKLNKPPHQVRPSEPNEPPWVCPRYSRAWCTCGYQVYTWYDLPMCRVYTCVPGVHMVWPTHVPGVHVCSRCTHGMTYPCARCTRVFQMYTWYDLPVCQVYTCVPGVHMVWPTHVPDVHVVWGVHMVCPTNVPGVHVGARCTRYDLPMCRVYMWVSGVHITTYPCAGCTAIARGLCTSLQTMTFLMSPSRSDTSILDVPESVQNSLSWTQSTAMPPTTHKTQSVQHSQRQGHRLCEVNAFSNWYAKQSHFNSINIRPLNLL